MAREIDDLRRELSSGDVRPLETSRPSRSELADPRAERHRARDPRRLDRGNLTERHREALFEIGRFRTLEVADLSHFRYPGARREFKRDLRQLVDQGLVQRRSVYLSGARGKLDVAVLTRAGKRLLNDTSRAPDCGDLDDRQAIYSGFVKPSEVAHDGAIYRMYQAEARRIAREGGTIRRIVLDYELKRKVYSPLAKTPRRPAAEYARRQAAVAQANGLKVVHGKIPLPDLRIEFETRDGQTTRVDLELATHHYHGAHLQEKIAAGFTLYASEGTAGRLTRVIEEREITTAILSL